MVVSFVEHVISVGGGGCICAEHSRKFSMQTYLTDINIILFYYYHASLILDNLECLYLEDGIKK